VQKSLIIVSQVPQSVPGFGKLSSRLSNPQISSYIIPMTPELENAILKASRANKVLGIELIQKLWSGYGRLERVQLDTGSVILKLIKFPSSSDHPRGWNTNLSHERKEKSYRVEMNWYQNHNDCIDSAYSPRLLDSGETETGEKWLLLEDLSNNQFYPRGSIKDDQVKLCLKWLAKFHAHYLGKKTGDLWQVGTYWHLETRPDELAVLDDTELKNAAKFIDQKLSQAKFQTIVHGDAKLANFLFSETEVAAVDFQYIGGGVGVKDVAYFLSSIYYEDELDLKAGECLNYYFKELNLPEVEQEWRELYPWAWSDFYRFLKGWSPGHYKLNTYSEKMKDKVLSWI
jgi:serine/threonine protein kinase